jgi:hypothetical protein
MCGLQAENNEELSDLVAVVVCCWTSFRAEDLHGLLSKNVAKVSMTNTAPRMWKFYLERMKNDPLGQGPVHDREFMVPCICIEGMKNTNEIKAWKRMLQQNPAAPCSCVCPYAVIQHYMSSIPDPFGKVAESNHKSPLHFMRAKTTTGLRRFIETPLGEEDEMNYLHSHFT